eukprot:365244-Chlamydomonas_euryale.AAC.7
MQQLVRQVAVGLFEPLFVERLDDGVVVGAAQLLALVNAVHRGLALLQDLLVGRARLAAAADAAARARHDLDEVVLRLASLERRHELLGVAEAVGDRDAQLQPAARRALGHVLMQWGLLARGHRQCRLLDALETAHLCECVREAGRRRRQRQDGRLLFGQPSASPP